MSYFPEFKLALGLSSYASDREVDLACEQRGLTSRDLENLQRIENLGRTGEERQQLVGTMLTTLAAEKAGNVVLAGDQPGHPFRGNQYGDGDGEAASTSASNASERAGKTGSYKDHIDASEKHSEAARLVRKAGGSKEKAHEHLKAAAYHFGVANKKAAIGSEQAEIAGDQPGHPFRGNQHGDADEASAKADDEDTYASHKDAERANTQASKAAHVAGDVDKAAAHNVKAEYHRKRANQLVAGRRAASDKLSKSKKPSLGSEQAELAGDQPGHPFRGNQHGESNASENLVKEAYATHAKATADAEASHQAYVKMHQERGADHQDTKQAHATWVKAEAAREGARSGVDSAHQMRAYSRIAGVK